MLRFLFFLLLPLANYAQILNADKFGTGIDSTHRIKVQWDFGANINKQQTFIVSFDTKLDMAYWYRRNIFILVGNFNLFRTGSKNLLNGGYSHLRWRYMGYRWLQPEIFSQYQLDGIRGMRRRALAGANLRVNIWEAKNNTGRLSFGIGTMYEYEYWDYSGVPSGTPIPDNTPIENQYLKLNSYLSYTQKINSALDIQCMAYFQSRPDRHFVYPRFSNDIALNINITKHIKFTIKWAMFYDALPPVPVTRLTYSAMNKITFVW